jgi:phosphate uptake regulator
MARFDEELTHLKGLILKMGGLVESSIKDSVKSLVERNDELAKAVICSGCTVR